MKKINIRVATIGHMPVEFDRRKINNWESDVFAVVGEIESYTLANNADGDNWEFTDNNLEEVLPKEYEGDFLIAILNVPIEANYYSRRLSDNRIIATFHEIKEILSDDNIPLENIIYRLLYAYTLVFKINGGRIPLGEVDADFTHDETRGCLFDMTGIKTEIIYSCRKPIICTDCVHSLEGNHVSNEVISKVQQEIKNIKKPLFYRIMAFIKQHPILSLVISIISAIALGAIGSYIATLGSGPINFKDSQRVSAVIH